MKDRILQVMEKMGLTQAQFAAEIGIQRAAMSHIASGRNNPSLDVLTKILSRYPSIDSDWLLFGKGDMFRAQVHISEDIPTEMDDLSKETQIVGSNLPGMEREAAIMIEKPSKLISKIMVFYSDNTFDTFVLEKK